MSYRKSPLPFLFLFLLFLSGCAINPVTGERELSLVGQQQEIAIGDQQYEPGRQMQGGDYLVDKQLSAYITEVGQKLAAVSDRRLPYEFTILNNSTPNAWALPGGKIVINRGLLLELHNEAELAAVLSHEIVHAAARHGAKSMERGMILQGALLATSLATENSDFSSLAVGGAQIAAGLITQRYSREAEREADYYGMLYMARAGYDPQSAIHLQETFLRLSEDKQPNWLSGLFASHPPSRERVEANKQTALLLRSTGRIGAKEYQQKLRYLHKTAPAYVSHDQAIVALRNNDPKKSLILANEAVHIEPKEALFHGLRGDIFFSQQKFQPALAAYNRAINLNNRYFHFYEQRGLVQKHLGNMQGARQDLTTSSSLLPTATSYYELGKLALEQKDIKEAKRFFLSASSSQSQPGKNALAAYIRLDLPDRPGKYLTIRREKSSTGQVQFRVSNPTPLPLRNISLQGRFLDSRGQINRLPLRIGNILRPGESRVVSMESHGVAPKYQHGVELSVVSAEIAQ